MAEKEYIELDLINRQKEEIESLKIAIEVTRDNLGDARAELQKAEAEIERLKKILGGTSKVLSETCAGVRVEAIKEFAERLKESAFSCDVSFGFGREHCEEAVTVLEIDNLVKEMTEETP